MEKNAGSVIVEFNNRAAAIYDASFERFHKSILSVNRQKDDNVFRLQSSRYLTVLREQLEEEAKKILTENSGASFYDHLNVSLPSRIHFYLQEFNNRVNSL